MKPTRQQAARPADGARPPRRTAFTGRAAVLALVLVGLALTLAGPLRQFIVQRAAIADLRAQVHTQQQRVDALQQESDQWKDPAYVEQQARERLHYVMPGEVPYIDLTAPTGTEADPSSTVADPVHDGPWYSKLWSTVQGASTPPPPPAATSTASTP